jgi:hypothetical protein
MGSGEEAAAGAAGNIHLAPQAGDMMAQAMVAQAMAACSGLQCPCQLRCLSAGLAAVSASPAACARHIWPLPRSVQNSEVLCVTSGGT